VTSFLTAHQHILGYPVPFIDSVLSARLKVCFISA